MMKKPLDIFSASWSMEWSIYIARAWRTSRWSDSCILGLISSPAARLLAVSVCVFVVAAVVRG